MTLPTVVLTGGSTGIGRAIASRHVSLGERVINLSRRPCPVAGVENIAGDLADSAAIERAKDHAKPHERVVHSLGVAQK